MRPTTSSAPSPTEGGSTKRPAIGIVTKPPQIGPIFPSKSSKRSTKGTTSTKSSKSKSSKTPKAGKGSQWEDFNDDDYTPSSKSMKGSGFTSLLNQEDGYIVKKAASSAAADKIQRCGIQWAILSILSVFLFY